MTVKEKAQRYDEALEKAKKELQVCGSANCDASKQIFRFFPELKEKESEGEKIRETLIRFFKDNYPNEVEMYDGTVTVGKALAWLQDTFSKKDVDDAYLKGIEDAKNEIEKQYEADYQIRKDIATFIFNSRGDIKDRAKWMNYLGIKVSFVDEQGEKRHKFIIGDIIISNNNTVYRVENIVQNCIGQDCYFLVNIELEKKGIRYLKLTDSRGKASNFGERTCLCEQVDAKFKKQSGHNPI